MGTERDRETGRRKECSEDGGEVVWSRLIYSLSGNMSSSLINCSVAEQRAQSNESGLRVQARQENMGRPDREQDEQ